MTSPLLQRAASLVDKISAKGGKPTVSDPVAKEAAAPKAAGALQTKYLTDSIKGSHEALRIFDNELAALEKDAKSLWSATPPSVTKILKLVEKFRSLGTSMAEALSKAEGDMENVKMASVDPWKVQPSFGILANAAQDQQTVQQDDAKIQEKAASDPTSVATEFLESGEAHPALQAIQAKYAAVVTAQKKARRTKDLSKKTAGVAKVEASDLMTPVIAEIKGLAHECAVVAAQLQKRTQSR